jgi:hypothetical protein
MRRASISVAEDSAAREDAVRQSRTAKARSRVRMGCPFELIAATSVVSISGGELAGNAGVSTNLHKSPQIVTNERAHE